jgi:ribosomal protein L11 methyltransferase
MRGSISRANGPAFPPQLSVPLSRKTVLGFSCEQDAVRASAILSELPAFEAFAFAVREEKGRWFAECYDGGALARLDGEAVLRDTGIIFESRTLEDIPAADWVAETQRALCPVRAGRFIVHGSHDRGRVASQWAIEIEAGRAFGTSHHGTTKGCLLAIDSLPASFKPNGALDLGTGTGVLAIAAAKAFRRRIEIAAADIDPIAVHVARENCRKNGTAGCVRLFVADGSKPRHAYRQAPFELVIANILAKPLLKLAPRLCELTKPGGILILSGLLTAQAREIAARYCATGFRLVRRRNLEGWATLMLRRTH